MTRDERLALIVAWTKEGRTAPSIAAALGVTPRTVARARARAGVAQPGPRRIPAATLERAHQLLQDGASRAEVSRTLGISHKSVSRHFPGTGWTAQEASALAAAIRAARFVDR